MLGFDGVFVVTIIKPLNKQSNGQWNEMCGHSCYITVMHCWKAQISSSTGLGPFRNKLLPESMLTQISDTIQCNYATRWLCHQMETFYVLLIFCSGNSPITGEFPTQRPVTLSFDVFFHLCLNRQLSKQWRRWWFEMQPHSLWRHCNDNELKLSRMILLHQAFITCEHSILNS